MGLSAVEAICAENENVLPVASISNLGLLLPIATRLPIPVGPCTFAGSGTYCTSAISPAGPNGVLSKMPPAVYFSPSLKRSPVIFKEPSLRSSKRLLSALLLIVTKLISSPAIRDAIAESLLMSDLNVLFCRVDVKLSSVVSIP